MEIVREEKTCFKVKRTASTKINPTRDQPIANAPSLKIDKKGTLILPKNVSRKEIIELLRVEITKIDKLVHTLLQTRKKAQEKLDELVVVEVMLEDPAYLLVLQGYHYRSFDGAHRKPEESQIVEESLFGALKVESNSFGSARNDAVKLENSISEIAKAEFKAIDWSMFPFSNKIDSQEADKSSAPVNDKRLIAEQEIFENCITIEDDSSKLERFDKRTIRKVESLNDIDKLSTAELFNFAPVFGLKCNLTQDTMKQILKDIKTYVLQNKLSSTYLRGYQPSFKDLFTFKDE
eukprot:TRINITY_DN4238_c0_g1_i2.p1 TRINITY_DN4238_c0_g1~~TRINITY_DN4238_c0_g1_i2.p1  ORF type:complete len:292 (-),score=57.39 TRINITY_DN4238_c0_g1_i2:28-903(-)